MITLIILDGLGYSTEKKGNAVYLSGTPYLKKLEKKYAHTLLNASGKYAGLPNGQMGNSEAGHLTLGAGRPVFQELSKINNTIKDKSFFNNKYLKNAFEYASETGGAVHLLGLCSDGGVHSHINHLKALIDMSENYSVKNVYLHAFLDGRDTKIDSGKHFMRDIQKYIKNKKCKIASISGRIYAMDREKNFDRTMKAYDAIVLGKAEHFYQENDIENAIQESYDNNIFDEYMEPIIFGQPKTINTNDAVIFFNFRKDRARQLTEAITQKNFKMFPTKHLKENYFVEMTDYDKSFENVHIAFPDEDIKNTLAEVLEKHNLYQYHLAETTKYAHVTYYFNGGKETEYAKEKRKLIDTIKVKDFSETPEMRALEITEKALDIISKNKYDFLLINFSNPDMVGHTANIDATTKAVKCTDKCAYAVAMATLLAGGECVITADHGNAECLINPDGSPNTAHTTNPVPFILVSQKKKYNLKKNGGIANVAPTILDLFDIDIPPEMEASLIKK